MNIINFLLKLKLFLLNLFHHFHVYKKNLNQTNIKINLQIIIFFLRYFIFLHINLIILLDHFIINIIYLNIYLDFLKILYNILIIFNIKLINLINHQIKNIIIMKIKKLCF